MTQRNWILLVVFLALFGAGSACLLFFWPFASPATSDPAPVPADSTASAAVHPDPTLISSAPSDSIATFSLNMQDFAYPDESVAVLNRALDLHEQYGVPVDVFLTGTIARYYAEHAPDLVERLKTSPMVAVSYHVRPPAPYTNDFDWYGLGELSASEQYDVIMNYETHDIDLVTGQPTNDAGGYQYVKDLIGYAPYAAGVPSSAGLTTAADKVMVALGAQMDIVHTDGALNIGEKKNGLWIRPETVDLKLFEIDGADGAGAIDGALASASAQKNAEAPYFVNVKMHDNDFFAEDSAWTTVFLAKGSHRRPPFDLTLKSELLSDADAEEMWARYESAVQHADALRDAGSITFMNIPDIIDIEP